MLGLGPAASNTSLQLDEAFPLQLNTEEEEIEPVFEGWSLGSSLFSVSHQQLFYRLVICHFL